MRILYWKFWWAFFWRQIVILIPIGCLLYFAMLRATDGDVQEAVKHSYSIGYIIGIFVQVAVLKNLFNNGNLTFIATITENSSKQSLMANIKKIFLVFLAFLIIPLTVFLAENIDFSKPANKEISSINKEFQCIGALNAVLDVIKDKSSVFKSDGVDSLLIDIGQRYNITNTKIDSIEDSWILENAKACEDIGISATKIAILHNIVIDQSPRNIRATINQCAASYYMGLKRMEEKLPKDETIELFFEFNNVFSNINRFAATVFYGLDDFNNNIMMQEMMSYFKKMPNGIGMGSIEWKESAETCRYFGLNLSQ